MRLKGILVAAGILGIAGLQSATAATLEVYGGGLHTWLRYGVAGTSTNPDGTVNPGDGITYSVNFGVPGSGGTFNLNSGGGNVPGSWALFTNSGVGNVNIAYANPNTPSHLLDPVTSGSMLNSFTGTDNGVGALISLLSQNQNLVGTGLSGIAPNSTIFRDLTDPLLYGNPQNFGLTGYTGSHATFLDANGNPNIAINLGTGPDGSLTCQALGTLVGCVGDQKNLLRPDLSGQNAYMQFQYLGFSDIVAGNQINTYQNFLVHGQNALVNPVTGVNRAHTTFWVQVRYLSGTRSAGGTPVPEPMTMSLLGGALGVGALRRRFKKA